MSGGFTVQCEKLDEIVRQFLLPIVIEMEEVQTKIARTAQYDDAGMFGKETKPDFCAMERVKGDWARTRDFFTRILADDSTNLKLAAEALTEIANRYRQIDGQG
jgi:hypothetical protein